MTTLYLSIFSLLLYFLISGIYASTCPPNSCHQCCPFAGVGKRTCSGEGTTDTADLIELLLPAGGQYCLLGQTRGLFYVLDVDYNVMRGGKATLMLRAIVAYAIEVPSKSGTGESTIYLIAITGCVQIRIVRKNGRRLLDGTPLTDADIYNAIQVVRRPYKAPCNIIAGADLRRYPQYFENLAFYNPVDCSRAISFQYIQFNGKNSNLPDRIIREHGFRVTRVNNSDTYVESNYLNLRGGQDCSTRPDTGVPVGDALNRVGFSFVGIDQNPQRVLCELSLLIAGSGASAPFPYFLYYEGLVLFAKSYDRCIVLRGYVDSDLGIPLNKKLVQFC